MYWTAAKYVMRAPLQNETVGSASLCAAAWQFGQP
jgi:hypothetical protein